MLSLAGRRIVTGQADLGHWSNPGLSRRRSTDISRESVGEAQANPGVTSLWQRHLRFWYPRTHS